MHPIIDCQFHELVSLKELEKKINPKNRNNHSQSQIERLADIMRVNKVRYPIVISNQTQTITKGHGRLLAALFNKWEKFPVQYQDYDSPDLQYADEIADNAIASWAELDLAGINLDVPDFGPDFDIDLLGIKDFTLDVVDKYDIDSVDKTLKDKSNILEIIFATQSEMTKVYEEMCGRGYIAKVKYV